jgi:IS5 family transposase
VLHARALPGNPSDGYTLGGVIEATEKLTGCPIERAYVDKGYRGHKTTTPRRVFISGQKRGVFGIIKRELRRDGDAANVVLSAVGHNLRLVLAWLRMPLRLILNVLSPLLTARTPLKWAS